MMNKVSRNIVLGLLLLLLVPVLAQGSDKVAVSEQDRRKAEYILLEAQNQKQQENSSAFYDLVRYAHEIDPTNTAISYYLGYCMISLHDVGQEEFEKGLKLMRAHVDAHPSDFYESMLYSDACMAVGQLQEGLRVMKHMARLNPSKVEVQVRLADGYARQGEFRQAIALYDSIELTQGKSIILTGKKLHAFQSLNDTIGALNVVRSLLATAPRNADYNIAMASMFQQFGEGDSAIAYLDKAQQYEPENGNAYLAKAQYYNAIGDSVGYDNQTYKALVSKDLAIESKLDVLTDYARHLLIAKDSSQRAEKLFNVLLEQHPHESVIRDLYSDYLVAKEDFKGAAEQLGYALDIDPTDSHSWHRLMLVNMMDENYPAAIKAAEQSLALNPDSIELYGYIAPAYYEMKEYDKAIATYNAALEKCDTANVVMRSNLMGGKGDVYVALGDTVKAFEMYEECLKVNPQNISVMNNYAYFLAVAGRDLDKAESMSGKAVSADSQNSTFLDTYAWVFFKKKDYKMALFYIESAIGNDQTASLDLMEHYGDILYFNSQVDKAVEQWEKVLEKKSKTDDTTLLQRKIKDKKYYEK